MNTFLNVGYINYLKESEKCFMFSFSIPARNKYATTFYCEAVVFKNEWTPKLANGQKVFIKGSIALEAYKNNKQEKATKLKLFADSIEIISNDSEKQEQENKKESYKEKSSSYKRDIDKEGIPF